MSVCRQYRSTTEYIYINMYYIIYIGCGCGIYKYNYMYSIYIYTNIIIIIYYIDNGTIYNIGLKRFLYSTI